MFCQPMAIGAIFRRSHHRYSGIVVKFMKEFSALIMSAWSASENEAVISILTLVDTTLIAILLIIIFSTYENIVSKISLNDREDRLAWMDRIVFADIKLKLIDAIVAISAIELLKAFLVSDLYTTEKLGWKVGIHLTLVFYGVCFVLTDWNSESRSKEH